MTAEPGARADAAEPSVEQVWAWLAEIEDPEIPVISIVDLGIVREVRREPRPGTADPAGDRASAAGDGADTEWVVTLTPTYSGCPATEVIARSVIEGLAAHGITRVRLEHRISPAWTTDWLSEQGRRKLRAWGIAPPVGSAAEQVVPVASIGRGPRPSLPAPAAPAATPECPHCGATEVGVVSQFGSTPCKALYRCHACLEPFDYFKCH